MAKSNKPKRIGYFDGTAHDFLSNFHAFLPIKYDGKTWPTTEHAFQAMKTLDVDHRELIRAAKTPGEAKGLGQRDAFERAGVEMRGDWETAKHVVMLDLLRIKFAHPRLRKALDDTGETELVEGNVWNDTCWGVECLSLARGDLGRGQNHLGRLLMRVRAENRPQITELWHVVGIKPKGYYVETVERKSLTSVTQVAKAMAKRVAGPGKSVDQRVAVMLGRAKDGNAFGEFGGGTVEIERVK